ncbi:MAG: RsmB/NOP family class I SAM-dependent RNA methyltransferase [Zestosphaera sp.]
MGVKGPYEFEHVDVIALIEAVKLAERVKPAQQAKRDAFRRFNILGTRRDPPLTAIFHSIMLRLGLIDCIVRDITGVVNPLLLDATLRAVLRVFIGLGVFCRDRVKFQDFNMIKNRVSQYLSENSHPYSGMWFWDVVETLMKYEYKPRTPEDELVAKYLLPTWYVRKIQNLIGEEHAEELFKAFLRVPKIAIRVNTLKSSVEEVFKAFQECGVKELEVSRIVPTVIKFKGPFNFDRSNLVREGKIVVQDEAAALAAILLDPKPGEVVVDIAAAPGGKTQFIGELMRDEGIIYAFDVDQPRISKMRRLLKGTGVTIVRIYRRDGRDAPNLLGEDIADKVLVDPPCSSDGTLMKNHDLRWRLVEDEVPKLAQLQYELLLAGLRLLKRGGRLLYSTCSLLREENEDVVLRALKKRRDVRLIPLKGPYDEGFIEGTMRAWPQKHGTTGFFYALLIKEG